MIILDLEQAYIAVNAFLMGLWRRTKQPGELAVFCDISSYTPGVGTADPAMWSDWLAAVKKIQTGVNLPDPERDALSPQSLKPLDPEQAYLAMCWFIEEYWDRISRPAELGDLLGQLRYTPAAGSADPSMWQFWLETWNKVHAGQNLK